MKQHENVRGDEQSLGDEEIKLFCLYCICYAIYDHIQFNKRSQVEKHFNWMKFWKKARESSSLPFGKISFADKCFHE